MNRVTRGQNKWTPEMDRQLVNMRNYGIHKNEVADRLGVTVAASDARYYRLRKAQAK